LKSFAYAGVAVVGFAVAAAVIVTPAAIVLLSDRLDSLDVRQLMGRILNRSEGRHVLPRQPFWYRWTKFVMRHAAPIGVAVIAILLLLGSPFLGVRWGFPDERVLPTSASSRQVGEQLRSNFPGHGIPDVSVVLPDAAGVSLADLGQYAAALSQVPDGPGDPRPPAFVHGARAAAVGAHGLIDGSAFMTVGSTAPLFPDASAAQLTGCTQPDPAGKPVQLAGVAQSNHDSVHATTSRLPSVLELIAVITLVLVLLLTGSVVLPVKAVLMNILSLTAAFGALVWVFQEGHLGALGSAVTGTLDVNLQVMLL
jgi:RND superfamily putative drug exporter